MKAALFRIARKNPFFIQVPDLFYFIFFYHRFKQLFISDCKQMEQGDKFPFSWFLFCSFIIFTVYIPYAPAKCLTGMDAISLTDFMINFRSNPTEHML